MVGDLKRAFDWNVTVLVFSFLLNAIQYECKSVSTSSFVICFLIICSSNMGAFIQLIQNKGLFIHVHVCSCLCKYSLG